MKGGGINALMYGLTRCVVGCYQNNESRGKGGLAKVSHGNLFVTDGQMPERALKSIEARLRYGQSMQIRPIKRTR